MENLKVKKLSLHLGILFLVIWLSPNFLFAQKGKITREIVYSKSLENTVTKEDPKRNVSVYLPPSYEKSKNKRYPVLYLLHGIGDTDQTWTTDWSDKNRGFGTIKDAMDIGIFDGKFGEMIVVMPDQKTNWFGSFYVNSSVTGNWDDFTSRDLVEYIDNKYRTLTDSKNRGIAGHSMGGYGAITLAIKHPDVFSVSYGMNPAIIDWGGDLTIDNPSFKFVLRAKSFEEVGKTQNIYNMGIITVAQAFSPNPNNPPFYCDFPYKMEKGKLVPNEKTFDKWAEHSPIKMVKKYRSNLMKLRALRFDSGYEDEFKFIPFNSRALSSELTNNGIEHIFEEYNGDHRNRMWGKRGRMMTEVLPYFWELLKPQR